MGLTEAALEVAYAAQRVERSLSKRRLASAQRERDRSTGTGRTGWTDRPRLGSRESGSSSTTISPPPAPAPGLGLPIEGSPNLPRGRKSRGDSGIVLASGSGSVSGSLGLGLDLNSVPALADGERGERGTMTGRRPSRTEGRGNNGMMRSPGRAGAGVVFMGIWVFLGFGMGGLQRRGHGQAELVREHNEVGRVVGSTLQLGERWTMREEERPEREGFVLEFHPPDSHVHAHAYSHAHSHGHPADDDTERDTDTEDGHPHTTGSYIQRVIGRISAWTCTTLYLTSRLPQIWKNVSLPCARGVAWRQDHDQKLKSHPPPGPV
jgi:hypothetical protein